MSRDAGCSCSSHRQHRTRDPIQFWWASGGACDEDREAMKRVEKGRGRLLSDGRTAVLHDDAGCWRNSQTGGRGLLPLRRS